MLKGKTYSIFYIKISKILLLGMKIIAVRQKLDCDSCLLTPLSSLLVGANAEKVQGEAEEAVRQSEGRKSRESGARRSSELTYAASRRLCGTMQAPELTAALTTSAEQDRTRRLQKEK